MWVKSLYKICPQEKKIFYTLGKPFPKHCLDCGAKLETLENAKNVVELFKGGHSTQAIYILQKLMGRVPPSCTVEYNKNKTKFKCTILSNDFIDSKNFKEQCLICQSTLLKNYLSQENNS